MENTTEPKIYTVPNELGELMDEAIAAGKASESAANGYFKFQLRNAIYLRKISIQKDREFWKKLRELYPELSSGSISHCPIRKVAWKGEVPYPGND